jgi:hypothetical protein
MKGFNPDLHHFQYLYNHLKDLDSEELTTWINGAKANNPWFTAENVKLALDGIITLLEPESLKKFIHQYPIRNEIPKKVGVIMAGNIPAVGFHDLLCVLLSGNQLYAKLSSDDNFLLKKIADVLFESDPLFRDRILFVDQLKHIEACITTGSDNSAKYFEYYFRNIPHVIRRNRTSVAILSGNEKDEELMDLGNDVFSYFGLGCRNVSHLLLPEGYSPVTILKVWDEHFSHVSNHHKYMNNYEYNRAIFLIDQVTHFDNGYILLKESESIFSSIATLTYSFYKDTDQIERLLDQKNEQLQCIVSKQKFRNNKTVSYGMSQKPLITDFADGVDTMKFLLEL